MKVAYFFAVNFWPLFRVKKWPGLNVLDLVSVGSIASMGRWTFFEKWIFEQTDTFDFAGASTTNPCPIFWLFWSFSKPQKWPFYAILRNLATRLAEAVGRKSEAMPPSFKMTVVPFTGSSFGSDFGIALFTFQHDPAEVAWRSKIRSGRAKTVKNHQNHQKSVIFQTKSAFAGPCAGLIILSWTSVSAPCAVLSYTNQNF